MLKFLSILVAAAGVAAIAIVYAPAIAGQHPALADRQLADVARLAGHGPDIGVAVRDADNGVVVTDVRPGSAAETAGVKAGDVIVNFDGERVRSARQFTRLVAESVPDRAVKATVEHAGRKAELSITPVERRAALVDQELLRERMGEVADMVDRIPFAFDFDLTGSRARLGVVVHELTPQLAAYFGAEDGVLVASVEEGSPAAGAGLKAGDVIAKVDHVPVRSRADLVHALHHADSEVTLAVVRDRKPITLKAKIEDGRRTTRR